MTRHRRRRPLPARVAAACMAAWRLPAQLVAPSGAHHQRHGMGKLLGSGTERRRPDGQGHHAVG